MVSLTRMHHWIASTKAYRWGKVRKEDFASALCAHKDSVDAMKSPHKEEADRDRGLV